MDISIRIGGKAGQGIQSISSIIAKTFVRNDKIPIGVIYHNQRPTLEEQIPAIAEHPLVEHQIEPDTFSGLLENFK